MMTSWQMAFVDVFLVVATCWVLRNWPIWVVVPAAILVDTAWFAFCLFTIRGNI